jgi:hypothetical protein
MVMRKVKHFDLLIHFFFGLHQPDIGWYYIARLEQNDIAGNKISGIDRLFFAIAHHHCQRETSLSDSPSYNFSAAICTGSQTAENGVEVILSK